MSSCDHGCTGNFCIFRGVGGASRSGPCNQCFVCNNAIANSAHSVLALLQGALSRDSLTIRSRKIPFSDPGLHVWLALLVTRAMSCTGLCGHAPSRCFACRRASRCSLQRRANRSTGAHLLVRIRIRVSTNKQLHDCACVRRPDSASLAPGTSIVSNVADSSITAVYAEAHADHALQNGRYDAPDRLFFSVAEAWRSSAGRSNTDLKELIPEFYLPGTGSFLRQRQAPAARPPPERPAGARPAACSFVKLDAAVCGSALPPCVAFVQSSAPPCCCAS